MKDENPVISPGKDGGFRYAQQWLAAGRALNRIVKAAKAAVDSQAAIASELVVTSRLLLFPSEVSRLPRSSRAVHVRSGVAWVTYAGRDFVARKGDKISLDRGRNYAIVSPLLGRPLVIEVLAGGN